MIFSKYVYLIIHICVCLFVYVCVPVCVCLVCVYLSFISHPSLVGIIIPEYHPPLQPDKVHHSIEITPSSQPNALHQHLLFNPHIHVSILIHPLQSGYCHMV